MLLAIDIGNTNVTLGVFDEERAARDLAHRHGRGASSPTSTPSILDNLLPLERPRRSR